MDVTRIKHQCPLCRSSFRHFPAVCWPLHFYFINNFRKEIEAREKDIRKLEQEEYHAESPSLDCKHSNHFGSLQEEFKCVECGNLAAPPTVLSCGHIVCCYTKKSSTLNSVWKERKCPVVGCVGKVVGDAPFACAIIDEILHSDPEMSPDTYDAAVSLSEKCKGLVECPKECDGSIEKDEEVQFDDDDICNLEGLASAKGSQLNGKFVKVLGYDSSLERYKVELIAPPSGIEMHCFTVKGKNLKCVHYGVGCDGCGQYPIAGRRFKCQDCSEEIGFDICGSCFDAGVHSRPSGGADAAGRFNQKHHPEHKMKEMKENTFLHQIQTANPTIPLSQIINMFGEQ